MNTTEIFRAKCRRMTEASYARLFAALAKAEKRRPILPKEANKTGGNQFSLEPYHRIVDALKGGPLFTREVSQAVGYSTRSNQATNILRRLQKLGVVERTDTIARGVEVKWWLSGRELLESDASALQDKPEECRMIAKIGAEQ